MIYIGIPTINLADHLARAVASIECMDEHRIIVANNNPNDKEFIAWVLGVVPENCEIITNKKNLGVAASWNQLLMAGINKGDAEIVFVLNDDIIVHPDCIDRMVETVRLHRYDAISAAMIQGKLERMQNFSTDLVDNRYNISGMHFSCYGLTPQAVETVGLFDEKYGLSYVEDTDYFYRLEQAGVKKGCDKYAWFTHYRIRERHVGDRRASHRRNRGYFKSKWGEHPKATAMRMMRGTRI